MLGQQMNLFGESETQKKDKNKDKDKVNKKTVKKKKNTATVNQEHLKEFVSIFQEIRIMNFQHDYQGDYRLVGAILRNAKNYEYEKVKKLLNYFKSYGLKEIDGNMVGFLTWAFLHPDVAKQPYNTIDLKKNYKGGNNNGKQKELPKRDKYDERFSKLSR